MKPAQLVCGAMGALLLLSASVHADGGLLRQADGTTTRITDLGNGVGIVTDPHGIHTPTALPPQPDRDFFEPSSVHHPGTVTPFGTQTPPSNLTPPPTLPFHPNRPLLPSQLFPSGTASSPGRFGRQ